jgi:hypothetical protein
MVQFEIHIPAAAEAAIHLWPLRHGLKPCPFKANQI